jgi:hypothetical protein
MSNFVCCHLSCCIFCSAQKPEHRDVEYFSSRTKLLEMTGSPEPLARHSSHELQYRDHRSSQHNSHEPFSPMIDNFRIEPYQRQLCPENGSSGTILVQEIQQRKEYESCGVMNIRQMPGGRWINSISLEPQKSKPAPSLSIRVRTAIFTDTRSQWNNADEEKRLPGWLSPSILSQGREPNQQLHPKENYQLLSNLKNRSLLRFDCSVGLWKKTLSSISGRADSDSKRNSWTFRQNEKQWPWRISTQNPSWQIWIEVGDSDLPLISRRNWPITWKCELPSSIKICWKPHEANASHETMVIDGGMTIDLRSWTTGEQNHACETVSIRIRSANRPSRPPQQKEPRISISRPTVAFTAEPK